MLVTVQLLQLPEDSGFGFGLSVTAAGLCMVPAGLAMVVLSPFSGAMLNKWGGRFVLVLGLVVMAVSYLGRIYFSGSVVEIIIGSSLVSIGTALAFAAMPTLIMGAVPITETAAANGLNSLVRSIGTSTGSAVVAAFLAGSTFAVADRVYPTETAFEHILWFGVVASVVGAGLSLLIPARSGDTEAMATRAAVGDEAILRGRLVLGDSGTSRPGTVALLGLDGEQLDWARVDNNGCYSLAVPGPGSYVAAANAVGWRPVATVFDFTPDHGELLLALEDELTLSGVVRIDGHQCAGASVVLRESGAGQVRTVATDDDGRFVHELPPAGYYVLVVIDPVTRRSRAQKVAVTVQAINLDIDL
jgi:MFS family permease